MNLKRDTEAPNYIIDLCCEQLRADGSLLTAIQRVLLALVSRCKTYGERESIAHTQRYIYMVTRDSSFFESNSASGRGDGIC